MTFGSLKKNVALQPLAVIMAAGMTIVAAFCIRSLTDHPDVSWRKEQTPQDAKREVCFKVYNPSKTDYEAYGKLIPQYRD